MVLAMSTPEKKQKKLLDLLDDDDIRDLLTELKLYHPADFAEYLQFLLPHEKKLVFSVLDTMTAADVIVELDDATRDLILKDIQTKRLSEIVDDLESDDAADIIEELPDDRAQEVLERISDEDAEEMLREGLARGADEAFLLADESFEGSDGYATARILAAFIKQRPYDLVLTGTLADDDCGGQLGGMLFNPLCVLLLQASRNLLVQFQALRCDQFLIHGLAEEGMREAITNGTGLRTLLQHRHPHGFLQRVHEYVFIDICHAPQSIQRKFSADHRGNG
jgi:hypothetical protein